MLKLTYSNLEFQNFPGEDPPLQGGMEGEGRGGEGGEVKEKGRGRIGKGGEGREGTLKERREGGKEWGGGGEGLGGALDMGSPQRQALGPPLCNMYFSI